MTVGELCTSLLPSCFSIVPGYTYAADVHETQVELRRRETLLGGLEEPFCGFGIVLWHTFAFKMLDTKETKFLGRTR